MIVDEEYLEKIYLNSPCLVCGKKFTDLNELHKAFFVSWKDRPDKMLFTCESCFKKKTEI